MTDNFPFLLFHAVNFNLLCYSLFAVYTQNYSKRNTWTNIFKLIYICKQLGLSLASAGGSLRSLSHHDGDAEDET